MDLSQVITIGTGALTLTTTVLILLTLLEMRSQRKASYRPEIVVKRDYFLTLFYRSGRSVGLHRLFICDSKSDPLKQDPEYYFQLGHVPLEACNVGLASAKHLHIHWEVDLNALSLFLAGQDPSGQVQVSKGKHLFRIEYPQRNVSISYGLQMMTDLDVDFLLPVDITKELHKVFVPQFYLHAIVVLVMLLEDAHHYESIPDRLEELPKIHLEIIYRDIENAQFKKSYRLDLNLVDIMSVEIPMDNTEAQDGEPVANRICGCNLKLSPE